MCTTVDSVACQTCRVTNACVTGRYVRCWDVVSIIDKGVIPAAACSGEHETGFFDLSHTLEYKIQYRVDSTPGGGHCNNTVKCPTSGCPTTVIIGLPTTYMNDPPAAYQDCPY